MRMPYRPVWAFLLSAIVLSCLPHAYANEPDAESTLSSIRVIQLELEGPIGPASSDYVARSLEYADGIKASLVVIRMDTPGGLDTAMRDIIKKIIAS